jgi:hypothetical protein
MRIFIGAIVLLIGGSGYAAPLLNFQLEGRLQGSDDPFASNVQVSLGDVVEYRLRLKLAPPGTVNSYYEPSDAPRQEKHGLNSMSAVIAQNSSAPIQVDFDLPANLFSSSPSGSRLGWDRGTGARGGSPLLRPGTPWHDLTDIRPIQGPGVFSGGVEETIFAGLFEVAAVSGASSQLHAAWGTISGGAWFDGRVYFITKQTEAGPDPLAQFSPLMLTAANLSAVPEPSTVVLAASALGIVALLRRRFTRKE